MAYIGNTADQQAFTPAIDYFNGDGSTVAFTLSRIVASVAQVQAVIENVPQNPGDAFTVSGNTITFTSAPPIGTSNIYVYYTSPITQVIQPGQGTVSPSSLSTGGPYWNTSGNVGIGTSSPAGKLSVSDGTVQIITVPYAAGSTGYFGNYTNHPLAFITNNSERMRIDSSGNVGVGTSTIASAAGVNLQIGDRSNLMQLTANNGLYFGNNLYYDGSNWRYNQTGAGSYMHCDTGAVAFGTATSGTAGSISSSITERLRIDSAGSTIVGVSSNSGQMTVRGAGISYPNSAAYIGVSPNYIGMAWASPNIYASVDNATYAVIGTVSDYRLKANSAPLENGLQTVLALRPITYNPVEFDGTVKENKTELGLIAHEVQAIRPSVVTGEKDAVNDEGNPRYQSVNYAGLVPDLIKAIQEQQAIIEDLKARIETLESK